MKIFYHLLFYKLYKAASLIRTKANATFITGFVIGLLVVFSIMNVLGLLNLANKIPTTVFILSLILSISINIGYFVGKSRYEIIISEMNSMKPALFHTLLVYLFLIWSIFGFLVL